MMRFLSYNIQYGLGRDGHYDLARIADEVRDADVIALQEVERFWQRSGEVDQPAVLAEHLPDHHWVFGANLDIHAGTATAPNRRRQFGTMLLSKTPILSSRNFPLPKFGTLRQHSIQQGVLEGVVDTPTGALRVYSIHLSHLCPETRLPQVEAILDIHRRAYGEGGAWCGGHPDPDAGWTEGAMPPMPREAVLMGDFNCAPGSAEYARVVGPSTEGYGRLANRDGFVDAWVTAGHDEIDGVSYPRGERIDYVFVSSDLASRVRAAGISTDAEGSDHWPVWAELAT
ncbi:MAG: endonuclease/exonuclease/phosphatase family protein [Pseudomonadota bacterium]